MTPPTWRARLDWVLGPAETSRWAQWLVSTVLIGLILLSAGAIVLETLEPVAEPLGWLLRLIEAVTVAVMVVEYARRLWAAPEREASGAQDPWRARLHYATSFVGIVDLLAALPAVLALVVPIPVDLLRLLRLHRRQRRRRPWSS